MEKIGIIILVTMGGAMLGSFASLLIWRLHFDEPGILSGRSRCPKCKKTLQVKNLIPIFSWAFQKGKCSHCGAKISLFYPIIELVFAGTFFLFAEKFYGTNLFIPLILAVFFLLVLFFYDVLFSEVDDRVVLPAILAVGVWSVFRELPFLDFLIGGAIGFGFYWCQYYFSGGRWVGAGDLRLGALMGLLLGWKLVILALFLAYILGAVVAVYFLVFKNYTRKSALPMGAFLMPATLIFLYDGQRIWEWYWGFLELSY